MCVFGLVGNGLSWAVLRWDRRSSGKVATFLLQTMAVVDNLFLLTAGISHITTAVTLYIDAMSAASPPTEAGNVSLATPLGMEAPPTQWIDLINITAGLRPFSGLGHRTEVGNSSLATPIGMEVPSSPGPDYINITSMSRPPVGVVRAYITAYVTVCVWPLVHITQMWAVWITVLVAFNRFVAICMPFQAHRLCTMKQVRYQMAGLCLSIIIYNIPRWLEYHVIYTDNMVNYLRIIYTKV